MRPLPAGVVLAAALVCAAPANADTTQVGANGNVFTGGLSFTPFEVTVKVGDNVEWRNTDVFVPHTSTEDHGLWDLTGDYGGTPLNPPGYAPGAVVGRTFEAGTHRYYCRVHPEDMKGTVAVPVGLATETKRIKRKRKVRGRRFKRVTIVVAEWAAKPPDAGLVFDVERRRGPAGAWTPLRSGTHELIARFRAGKPGTAWEVRARLRRDGSPEAATDWSPAAAVGG